MMVHELDQADGLADNGSFRRVETEQGTLVPNAQHGCPTRRMIQKFNSISSQYWRDLEADDLAEQDE